MISDLPQELKDNGLFCGWRLTERGKIPFNPRNDAMAKSSDRNTFVSYSEAMEAYPRYFHREENRQTGGIGLGIFNGYSAVDIDHCVTNGKPNQFAEGIIQAFQSYTEFSPSGTGIRIIFKTDSKPDKNDYYVNNSKLGLEVYVEGCTAKFVTLTGNIVYSYYTDIKTVDIMPMMNRYMKKTTTQYGNGSVAHTDVDISSMLAKDAKLNELWNSKASGSHGNESETDLALCNKLAFYCGRDPEKINQYFMQSPYFASKDELHTKKWVERDDYRKQTITTACNGCVSVYNPRYKSEMVNAMDDDFAYTDTGNAKLFVKMFGDRIRYNVDNKCWMLWNGKYWQTDLFDKIKSYAEQLVDQLKSDSDRILNDKNYAKNVKKLLSSNGKELMLKEAQHLDGIPCMNNDFDTQKYMVNYKSGVYDMENDRILPHSPSLMMSKMVNADISEKIPERFVQFLREALSDNRELIAYVLKVFAISLTGDTSEQKMWYFLGKGSDGKSLLCKVVGSIMGDYYSVANSSLIIDKKFQSSNPSEIARLKGKRCVTVSETDNDSRLNESAVKNMTGEDRIVARFLYSNEFEFEPEFKIIMMSNYEPKLVGDDYAIQRRVKIVKFLHSVPDDQQDHHLYEKLMAEKNEIFTMILHMYRRYLKEGLNQPQCVTDWSNEYFKDNDIIATWISEECVEGEDRFCTANELWERFRDWYEKRGEYFKYSQTLFGRALSKKFTKARINGKMVYRGITLENRYPSEP